MKSKCGLIILFFVIMLSTNSVYSLSIIPGEVGFGMDTPAGSGRHLGTPATNVCKVTNLNDSGPGSLRNAIENEDSPKTIVFEVSGYIDLASIITIGGSLGSNAETKGSYITIAGQTAPSPGITIRNFGFYVERNCHDILIQHLRFRAGDSTIFDRVYSGWSLVSGSVYSHTTTRTDYWAENVKYNGVKLTEAVDSGASVGSNQWDLDEDSGTLYVNVGENPSAGKLIVGGSKIVIGTPIAIDGHYRTDPDGDGPDIAWNGGTNIVIDHCSMAWAGDMNARIQGSNVTVSNCIIAEGLNHPYHPKGEHSKGLYFSSDYEDNAVVNVASVRNLFAHNVDRNPIFEGAWGIIVNDVAYDYKWAPTTIDGGGTGSVRLSLVGNYHIETDLVSYAPYIIAGSDAASKVFISDDNYWSGNVQSDPWNSEASTTFHMRESLGAVNTDVPLSNRVTTKEDATWPTGLSPMTAADAKTYVLKYAGARPRDKDALDTDAVADVRAASTVSDITQTIVGTNADCYGAGGPFECCTGAGTGTCPDKTWPALAENTRTFDIPSDYNEVQASGYTKLEELLYDYHYNVTYCGDDESGIEPCRPENYKLQ